MGTEGEYIHAYSAFVGTQKNMLSSSTVAVVMVGFASQIQHALVRDVLLVMAGSIFVVSIAIAWLGAHDFTYFLDHVEAPPPPYVSVASYRALPWINYFYIVLLVAFACGFFLLWKPTGNGRFKGGQTRR
jgi:hypothetical protein